MDKKVLVINLPLVSVDSSPRLVINLPMDVMVLAELLEACPVGAYTSGTEDGRALLIYWDDAAEKSEFHGVCQRRGCGNPVPPGRERWCSDECAAAGRKQREREHERGTVKQAYEQATARLRNPRCPEYVPPGEQRDRKRAALRDAMEQADGSVDRFWELASPILAQERLANNLLTDHAERSGVRQEKEVEGGV